MKYLIDEDKLYDLVDAEVSVAADGAYDKNGNPLFDGIVLTSKDGDLVKRLMHDAASRLVGRMSDIAKFSAELEEKKTVDTTEEVVVTPTRRLLTTSSLLKASSAPETILVDNADWASGLGAMSIKNSVLVHKSAGSILVGYNNRYGHYLTYYSDNPDWLTVTLDELDGQTCFRVSFTENTTGEEREGMFHMSLNARLPDGRKGDEFLGIYATIIQPAEDGASIVFGLPDDSDLMSWGEYFGHDQYRPAYTSLPHNAAIEFTGGSKLIPITFDDGSDFLDKLENGDVVLKQPDWNGDTPWCWFTPVRGGIWVDCDESNRHNYMLGKSEIPNERGQSASLEVRNLLNDGVYDITVRQRGIPIRIDDVVPYATPFTVGYSTEIDFDKAGETKTDKVYAKEGVHFGLAIDNASDIPSWLAVVLNSSTNTFTYTCLPNDSGVTRKFFLQFTATDNDSGDVTHGMTYIEQPSSFVMQDLGVSVNPAQIVFSGEYSPLNPERHTAIINIPSGYDYGFGQTGNFFTVRADRDALTVSLKSTNTTGAIKTGEITVYLYSKVTGWQVPGVAPAKIAVIQNVYTEDTDGDEQQTLSEPLDFNCDPGPKYINHFKFGVNGEEKGFNMFYYTGGAIINTEYNYSGEAAWFTLGFADKYKNTDQSSGKANYNPLGAFINCAKNELRRSRSGSVKVTVSNGLSNVSCLIFVDQDYIEDEDAPVITCADSIVIPASGYDGIAVDAKVKTFLPITLENASSYEISVPSSDVIVHKVNMYSDGISIWCNENTGNARNTQLIIKAYNESSSATKTVTVRQVGDDDQQPEPQYYAKVDKDSFVIKSVPDVQDIVGFTLDTNISTLSFAEVNYNDDSGDDWMQLIDTSNAYYEFSAEGYPNVAGAARTARIIFEYSLPDEGYDDVSVYVGQFAKPEIALAQTIVEDYPWRGGTVSVPFTLIGVLPDTFKVKESGAKVVPSIDLSGDKVVVAVSQNGGKLSMTHTITLEGENELGEKATATLTIVQGVQPTYAGDDNSSADDETAGSGLDALEFDVPDFDLNELVGTPYNQEGVFKTISRYFVLFACMKIFQERYPELVQIYTERAQSAMDDINNILRQRKRPKR